MNNDDFWRALLKWQDSDDGKRLKRTMEIADESMRIYEAAMRAMYPVRIITTDNTRPGAGKRTKAGGR